MTGRRLLDAAAIFKAARSVATKHVALRKHQLGAYSKTSALAKAAKSQTDRVTLTVKAASALAGRFDEPGPAYSTQASNKVYSSKGTSIPSEPSVEGAKQPVEQRQGSSQDYFHERSKEIATAESHPDGALGVKQEKATRYPLPDGSIPPAGAATGNATQNTDSYSQLPQTEPVKAPSKDQQGETDENIQPASSGKTSIPEPVEKTGPLSADQAKSLQRQAEKQIPSQAADAPSATSSRPETEDPGLRLDQEQDIFYAPSQSSGQVLSALPRVKLPKNAGDTQGSNAHVADAQMNQDVFYSSASKTQKQAVPEAQAVPEQEELPEEAYSEIFHSPRVAKMLRGQATKESLDLPGANALPIKHTKASEKADEVSSSMRRPAGSRSAAASTSFSPKESTAYAGKGAEDVRNLAADMAKDADAMPAGTQDVSLAYIRLTSFILIG